MRNVLITGGSGLLALNWAVTIRNNFSVTLGLHKRQALLKDVKTHFINLESSEVLSEDFNEIKPDIIVHTAGLTNVEACETNPELAKHINVELAVNLAQASVERDIQLIHISTDHLFAGRESPANETSILNPVNVYGQTKAEAERRIIEINPKALIIRTNFYGWGPGYRQSFSDWIIKSLRTGTVLKLFKDVFYTPILIEFLVNTVHELAQRNAHGIFHVVGDDHISKYEFGLKIAQYFELDTSLIKPCLLTDQKELVQRPHEMGLSNQKVSHLLDRELGGLDEHILRLRNQENSGFVMEIINQ